MSDGSVPPVTSNGLVSNPTPIPIAAATIYKPTPAGEFQGTELAVGVVTGARSFNVDRLGRLAGVTYPIVWRPGENVAKCYRFTRDPAYPLSVYYVPPKILIEQSPDHPMAGCGHGFYGYYEGSNDYYEDGRICGVIEGYGETLIGTRGFRASKARIVALHIPLAVQSSLARLVERNYPDIPRFDSFDLMIAAYPPDDAGQGLSPANDPDFWDRKA